MPPTNDNLIPRWHEIKGNLKKRWPKLTDDEISKLGGTQAELAYALRRRYGYALGQAMMEINAWLTEYERTNAPRRRPSGPGRAGMRTTNPQDNGGIA